MSYYAEQAVLAAVLVHPDNIDIASEILKPNDFSDGFHARVFERMCYLAEQGTPADPVTVAQALEEAGTDPQLHYLAEMAMNLPKSQHVDHYARIVKDAAVKRGLYSVGQRIMGIACEEGDALAKVDQAQSLFGELDGDDTQTAQSARDIAKAHIAILHERNDRGAGLQGITTGFKAVDERTGGLVNSDLIIIGARPSMGKTALAINMAVAAARAGVSVYVFSCEMSSEQIMDRIVSSVGSIPLKAVRNASCLGDENYVKVTPAFEIIKGLPLYIDDSPAMHINELRRRARMHKRKHGLGAVYVDYLQLLKGDDKRNRNNEVAQVSSGLKALAKELNIPVIALAQLNRDLGKRADKRPDLSDLRDSGQIEQDADAIFFLHRDDYYNQDRDPTYMAELIMKKFRNGETGTDWLRTELHYSRFVDYVGPAPAYEQTGSQKGSDRGFNY